MSILRHFSVRTLQLQGGDKNVKIRNIMKIKYTSKPGKIVIRGIQFYVMIPPVLLLVFSYSQGNKIKSNKKYENWEYHTNYD